MKKNKSVFWMSVFTLLCCSSSCEEKIDKYSITIRNNSDKEIISIGGVYTSISFYSSLAQDTQCMKLSGREYEDFIYDRMIKPYSSQEKGADMRVESMRTYPDQIFFMGVFYRKDIDDMSCEEFERKYPLKKEWQITLEDIMSAPDFNLILEYNEDF